MLDSTFVPAALFALVACLLLGGPASADEPAAGESDPAARLQREATEHHEAGRYAEAVRSWQKAIATRPDDLWIRLALARSLLGVATPTSLRRAETVLTEPPDVVWVHPVRGDLRVAVDETLATVLWRLADDVEGAERSGLIRRAITHWERLLTSSPRHPRALLGLTRASFALDQDAAGIGYAERYLDQCRESRLQWKKQRERWQAQSTLGATPEQLRFFADKIEGARKQEVEMLLLLAATHTLRHEPEKALTRYDAVVTLGKASRETYLGRARVHVALGRLDRAVTDLERCLEGADDDTPRRVREDAAKLLDRCRQRLRAGAPGR